MEHESEVERLRARVAELEAELADRAAAHQRRRRRRRRSARYWLDRWHLDLNARDAQPAAARALARSIRALRASCARRSGPAAPARR